LRRQVLPAGGVDGYNPTIGPRSSGQRAARTMRTSGAPQESALTYVPIVVGIIILVLLLGGPKDVLRSLEAFLTQLVLTVRDYVAAWL
jgi:hypothetical protein